jgi:hypothetical protein
MAHPHNQFHKLQSTHHTQQLKSVDVKGSFGLKEILEEKKELADHPE